MSIMTRDEFRAKAWGHLLLLIALFAVCLVFAMALGVVSDWAGDQRGWEAAAASFLLGGAAFVPGFLVLWFGVSIWAWFKEYRWALRKSQTWHDRPDKFRLMNMEVLGPIDLRGSYAARLRETIERNDREEWSRKRRQQD